MEVWSAWRGRVRVFVGKKPPSVGRGFGFAFCVRHFSFLGYIFLPFLFVFSLHFILLFFFSSIHRGLADSPLLFLFKCIYIRVFVKIWGESERGKGDKM